MAATRGQIKLRAPAKVNLTLEVLGERGDGYHELRSLVQCLSLADELTLRPTAEGITVGVCGEWAPVGRHNLCHAAATIFIEQVGNPGGVEIQLTKHIPAGRGLGGGSSNAAATLLGLCELIEEAPSGEQLIWPFLLRRRMDCWNVMTLLTVRLLPRPSRHWRRDDLMLSGTYSTAFNEPCASGGRKSPNCRRIWPG